MKRFIYAIALFLIFSVCAKAQRQTDASKKLSLAAYVISTLYVDDVNEDKLTEDAIRAMLEQLDPHSTYLDPQEVKDMRWCRHPVYHDKRYVICHTDCGGRTF